MSSELQVSGMLFIDETGGEFEDPGNADDLFDPEVNPEGEEVTPSKKEGSPSDTEKMKQLTEVKKVVEIRYERRIQILHDEDGNPYISTELWKITETFLVTYKVTYLIRYELEEDGPLGDEIDREEIASVEIERVLIDSEEEMVDSEGG